MTTASLPFARRDRIDLARIVRAGLTLGVCDFLAAMIVYVAIMHALTPLTLWQGVARSLLGKSALDGGAATAALGVAIHFGVAFGWATVYVLLYHFSPALRHLTRTATGTVLAGVLYGAFVHVMMSKVIVPMTLAPTRPGLTRGWWIGLAIHVAVVGQAVAWSVRDRRG